MNKYKARKCSIESSSKHGQTRLNLNNIDVENFLDECVYIEEEKNEEQLPPTASNPIYKYR